MRARIAFAFAFASQSEGATPHAEAWDGAGIFSMRVRVDDGVDDASVTRTKRVTTAREIWFT